MNTVAGRCGITVQDDSSFFGVREELEPEHQAHRPPAAAMPTRMSFHRCCGPASPAAASAGERDDGAVWQHHHAGVVAAGMADIEPVPYGIATTGTAAEP